jgi:hypothetical protein
MAVNSGTRIFAMGILAVILVAGGVAAQAACNVDILNRYLLIGNQYSLSNQMKICPNVYESCCTLADQISIHELWRSVTKHSLDRHRDKVIDGIYQTVDMFNALVRYDPKMILNKYRVAKTLNYTAATCRTYMRQVTPKDIIDVQNYYTWASQVKVKPKEKPDPFFNGWMSRNPAHAGWNVANYGFNYNKFPLGSVNYNDYWGPHTPNWVNKVDPNIFQQAPNFANPFEANMEKEPIPQTPQNDGELIYARDQIRPVYPYSAHRKLKHAKHPHRSQKATAAPSSPIVDAPPVNSRMYSGRSKRKAVVTSTQPVQSTKPVSSKSSKKHSLSAHERKLQIIQQSRRPSYIHNYQTECYYQNNTFFKGFTVLNTEKANFCMGLYKKFLNFDIDLFTSFVPAIKSTITSLQNSKKGFYCALCDGSQQKNFEQQKKTIIYNSTFCQNVLSHHIDYFKFMNVVYIQFADQMMQFIQCFESDAQVFDFPFQNFMRKYIRRIQFWEQCFGKLAEWGESTPPECWSICNKLSMTSISPLIEGDLKLVDRISATLFSFIRKMDVETVRFATNETLPNATSYLTDQVFNVRNTENVNGLLVEPVNPSDFINDNYFHPNKEAGKEMFDRDPKTGFTRRDHLQLAVNDLLEKVRLGNVDTLRNYWRNYLMFYQQGLSVNQKILANEDREKSAINKLVNQLYDLKSNNMLRSYENPQRYLRGRVLRVIKKNGIDPHRYERELHAFTWVGTNKTFNGTWRAVQNVTQSTGNFSDINSYGTYFENITPIAAPFIDPSSQEETEPDFAEDTNPIFQPINGGATLDNFGYAEGKSGIDPFVYSNSSQFNYNISKLITLQMQGSEPVRPDIIRLYMAAKSNQINDFNELGNYTTMNMTDLRKEYPQSVKLEKIALVRFFALLVSGETEKDLPKDAPSEQADMLMGMIEHHATTTMMVTQLRAYRDNITGNTHPSGKNDYHKKPGFRGHSFFERFVDFVSDVFEGLFGSERGEEVDPNNPDKPLEFRKLADSGAANSRVLSGNMDDVVVRSKLGTAI